MKCSASVRMDASRLFFNLDARYGEWKLTLEVSKSRERSQEREGYESGYGTSENFKAERIET